MFKQRVEVNHNGRWHTVTPIEVEGIGHVNQIYFKASDLSQPAPAPMPVTYGTVRSVNLMMVEADSPNVKISKITYGVINDDCELVDICPDEQELESRYDQLYKKTNAYCLVEIRKL